MNEGLLMVRAGSLALLIVVSIANAQIQFAPVVKYSLNAPDATGGSGPPALAIADFNKDGRPDVAMNFDSSVVVVLNKGDGTFNTPIAYSIPGSRTAGVVTGDFNRDGYPDLAVLSISGGPCESGLTEKTEPSATSRTTRYWAGAQSVKA